MCKSFKNRSNRLIQGSMKWLATAEGAAAAVATEVVEEVGAEGAGAEAVV